MGICGGFSAVAAKKKYPGFILLNSDHVDNDCIGGKWWMIIGGEDKLKSRQLRYILMTVWCSPANTPVNKYSIVFWYVIFILPSDTHLRR